MLVPLPGMTTTKSSRFKWGLLGLAVLLMPFIAGCDRNKPGSNAGSSSSRINPDVGVMTDGVVATNNEDYTYPRFTITLNPDAANGGYSAEFGDLGPGKTIEVPFSEFADSNGRRFNIKGMKITRVRARAWPNGEQSTYTFDFKEN